MTYKSGFVTSSLTCRFKSTLSVYCGNGVVTSLKHLIDLRMLSCHSCIMHAQKLRIKVRMMIAMQKVPILKRVRPLMVGSANPRTNMSRAVAQNSLKSSMLLAKGF